MNKKSRTINTLYMLAVFAFAGVFVSLTGSQAAKTTVRAAQAQPERKGAAGKARDVDMERLERLLLHGYLSEHEADYYERVPEDGVPAIKEDAKSEEKGQDEEKTEDEEHGHD